MSSIGAGQSVIVALTVTVLNKYSCLNIHTPKSTRTRKNPTEIGRRRGLVLSTLVAATQVSDSRTELLNKYLKKSEENKAKNDKERLDSYYKRNYKDYFDFVEGSLRNKEEKQLSEAEKGILDWLQKNK